MPERLAVVQGTCPNCGKGTQTYFGDIFVVQGSRETATVTCDQCKKKMEFNAPKRWVRLQPVCLYAQAAAHVCSPFTPFCVASGSG